MKSSLRQILAAGTVLSLLSACVTANPPVSPPANNAVAKGGSQVAVPMPDLPEPIDVDPAPELEVGYRPALNTDEGGWWMKMDRYEESLKSHASLVQDPALNAYIQGVVCRLAGDYCKDIRVYVVRKAGFNASMAPNGVMQVWTGLLLRTENEAQLAAVLGHELAHYYKLHSIKNWRTSRNTADVLAFVSLGTAGLGVGYVGLGASVIALGGLSSYSRSNESEADAVGQILMADAGYDPAQAAGLWDRVKREQDASRNADKRNSFLASHPAPEQRHLVLEKQAKWLNRDGVVREAAGDRLLAALTPHWQSYIEDELASDDVGRTEVVLQDLEKTGYEAWLISFYKGELFRKRGREGDLELAREAYLAALDSAAGRAGELPATIYRSLGLIALKAGDQQSSRENFKKYLQLEPEAHDAAFIRQMLEQS